MVARFAERLEPFGVRLGLLNRYTHTDIKRSELSRLKAGELDLILGNLDERRSFEDLMMDLWVLRQAEERRSALRRLGDSLVRARAQYEQVKETNEAVLGETGEAVSA